MAKQLVGAIASLWRYPVKSMLGEELEESVVTEKGLWGDRAYALLDPHSGKVASAKNPKKWADLLNFQATFPSEADSDLLPPVTMQLPDGRTITSAMPEVDEILSSCLGREVKMLSSVPVGASLEQYWPPVDGTAHQDAVTQLEMPAGTFFDSCPIHAITTATLNQLQELYPTGQFDRCRFRPNVVIEASAGSSGFVEDAWVGSTLAIGDSVRLHIDTHCPRCVVTTLAQSGLPSDLGILQTTARHNNVIAGIRLSVLQGGTIHRNDPIWLETA